MARGDDDVVQAFALGRIQYLRIGQAVGNAVGIEDDGGNHHGPRERSPPHLVDTGDIGEAMKSLELGLKEATKDAAVELANKALDFGLSALETFLPASSPATKGIGLAKTIGMIIVRVRAAILTAKAVFKANEILARRDTYPDGGASALFAAFPLAGAYLISVCNNSDLLLAFADIEGSLDAVPILKRMKKYHSGPVKLAARHLVDQSDWMLIPSPSWQIPEGAEGDGFLAKVERMMDAAEALQEKVVEYAENEVGTRVDRLTGAA